MPLKIAFIGAGSVTFTRRLARDILTVPEFNGVEFSFMDVNRENLRMVTELVRRDIGSANLRASVSPTLNRREAIRGARYVLCMIRAGGLEAFAKDIDIPLAYGIDQCVGDTLCAGGIMYAQRTIPVLLDICKDIQDVGGAGCLLLNYANPMAMNTWACNVHGGVPTLGLCHGVHGGHHQITQVIELLVNGKRRTDDPRYRCVTMNEVDIVCAGINHQTWYIRVLYNGEDWTGRLLEGFERHPVFSRTERVRIDMLRRFGFYSTESNGHLSEYLPWYRKRPREIRRWIDTSSWINGETGGYLRECIESRNWFKTDFPRWMAEPPKPLTEEHRSHEHASHIIEALETGRVYRGHFNVVNGSTIGNLPHDAIVEVPGYVDRNGIAVPRVGHLPPGCAAVCNASISVQRLAVQAAVRGDDTLLRQAMLLDPLNGAVCNPPEIWQLTDEMLVAESAWLPQYRRAIADARKRLARGKAIRTRPNYRGAVRLKPRIRG